MKLIILIPSFNEEQTIEKVITQIPRKIDNIQEINIIVIDDGSTDNTRKLAANAGAMVISHQKNKGVGSAFNTGLNKALELGADVMVNIDADGQFFPQEIPFLIQPIVDYTADFVSGDRFSDSKGIRTKPENMPKIKYWGNFWMARLISVLAEQEFHDVSCGFRAYSKEAMLWLNLSGKFTYTQETFLDFAFKGLEIKSLPVKVAYFKDRESKIANNILKYIIRSMKIILRAYRDYRPLSFFGWMGFFPFIFGLACGIFLLTHYILAGRFFPFRFIGFAGIYLGSLGIILWIAGLIADMFRRIRSNQENILYFQKKRFYQSND